MLPADYRVPASFDDRVWGALRTCEEPPGGLVHTVALDGLTGCGLDRAHPGWVGRARYHEVTCTDCRAAITAYLLLHVDLVGGLVTRAGEA
jgi:hypothetical protein